MLQTPVSLVFVVFSPDLNRMPLPLKGQLLKYSHIVCMFNYSMKFDSCLIHEQNEIFFEISSRFFHEN